MEAHSMSLSSNLPILTSRPLVPSLPKSHVAREQPTAALPGEVKIQVRNLDFYYGERQALFHVVLTIRSNSVTSFIGPSGCGKSTLLRCLNRMNDLLEGVGQNDMPNGFELGRAQTDRSLPEVPRHRRQTLFSRDDDHRHRE